jgi:hypothetical protein
MGKYASAPKSACRTSSPRRATIVLSYLAANQDRSVQFINLAVDPWHLRRCVQENARASRSGNWLQTKTLLGC